MKLSIKAFALSAAILWGAGMLIVTTINTIFPGYGIHFLQLVSSIYPGYDPAPGIKGIIVGTLYGIVDAGIAGAIFAWLYNHLEK